MLGSVVVFIPANSESKIKKGLGFTADTLLFDLEDSVSAEKKDEARLQLYHTLKNTSCGTQNFAVRINGVDTPYFERDVENVCKCNINTIVLPNATIDSVRALDLKLNDLKSNVSIVVLIESAEGVETANEIVHVSNRIVGMMFGAEDFTKDIGVRRTITGSELFYARSKLVCVAHMNHLEVIDTPTTALHDEQIIKDDAELAKSMGFTGKAVIHPKHIDIVRKAFLPTKEEINEALDIVSEATRLFGDGMPDAFSLRGRMIDLPIIIRARKVISDAEKYQGEKGEDY